MDFVTGLHHVTAIAGDPRRNLEFYTGVLGLRLVKKTVNQDVPDTYHLFYADGEGRPGTDLTFFPWPQMGPARSGHGLAMEVCFSVAPGNLAWWADRLETAGAEISGRDRRFGEDALVFADPEGMKLALIETERPLDTAPWQHSDVPEGRQLRGFHSVRLWERDLARTGRFLVEGLGMREAGADGDWHRYEAGDGGASRRVELIQVPDRRRGTWGTGAIHHVAFRVPGEGSQEMLRARVARAGVTPTEVIDRFWFRSIYFKEPGGALFEIATDGPGFAVDEEADRLGEALILPPWLEARRREIEAALPPIEASD